MAQDIQALDPRMDEELRAALRPFGQARQAYRDELEARLVASLPGPRSSLSTRLGRRRAIAGLVAAGLAVGGLGVAIPAFRAPDVSAAEIFSRVEAIAADPITPMAMRVKSYHIVGTHTHRPVAGQPARSVTTEQWFAAPSSLRVESRSTGPDGKPIISGTLMHDGKVRFYSTPGRAELDVIGLSPAPAAGRFVGNLDGRPGTKEVREVRIERKVNDKGGGVWVSAEGGGETRIVLLDNCREPRKLGNEQVAGRKTIVVERDFSDCMTGDAEALIGAKTTTWADVETFMPLKMESRYKDGTLLDRYEATFVRFDLDLPTSTFTATPPGTHVTEHSAVPGGFTPGTPAKPMR